MKKSQIIIILAFLANFSLYASFDFDDGVIGIGNLTQFVGKVQTDSSGGTRSFDANPYISLAFAWAFAKNWTLNPEIGIGFPSKTPDDNVSQFNYFLITSVGYNFMDWVFRAGLGFSFTRYSAGGGTSEVNNGFGSDPFFLPSESSTSRNLITTLGVEYYFHADWSARLDAHLFNLVDSDSRAFSYTGSLHYHFGKWSW